MSEDKRCNKNCRLCKDIKAGDVHGCSCHSSADRLRGVAKNLLGQVSTHDEQCTSKCDCIEIIETVLRTELEAQKKRHVEILYSKCICPTRKLAQTPDCDFCKIAKEIEGEAV